MALRHFRRQVSAPLLVVWDWLNAHRARRTAAFFAAHPRDFTVAYLPAYAPEPNPEEQCNACIKLMTAVRYSSTPASVPSSGEARAFLEA